MGILSRPEDRRASRRVRLDEIPEVTGVRICSEQVEVINASRGGMLVESALRLSPGTESGLEILRKDASLRLRGQVLRCQVVALSAMGLRYQIALAFNTPLDLMDIEDRLRDPNRVTLVTDAFAVVIDDAYPIELDPALALNNW